MPLRKPRVLADGAKGNRIKGVAQSRGGFIPNIQSGFARRSFAVDAGQGNAPFHCADDVRQSYGFGVAGKHMAPGDAPYAFDNSLSLQQAHDFLHKLFRNARTGGQFGSRSRNSPILFRKAQ